VQDCVRATVRTTAKIAAVVMDNCERVVLEVGAGVLSNVEMVRCRGCRLVLRAAAPTVVLDGCEGVSVEVACEEARGVTVLTTKCMEVNVVGTRAVLMPNGSGADAEEVLELPVPVQFRTTIDAATGALVTLPVDHIGV
jgi:Adenylate cyclase associated (CAP) C terminal